MTSTDLAASPLARAAARRHERALQAATATIDRLGRATQPINFSVVAQHAGVSRAWLYRQPEIRELITGLRSTGPRQPTVRAAQRASADSLRQRLDAATDEISRLRSDNAALRDQLARLLGGQRAHQNNPR
jgi:small-conductance mechanosensitive channel